MSDFIEQERQEAIKHLKSIDAGYETETVIDSEYYDIFWEPEHWATLEALKVLTGMPNYQTIHKHYEGYTIAELITEFTN